MRSKLFTRDYISLIYGQQKRADEMMNRLHRAIKKQQKGHLKLQTAHIRLRNITFIIIYLLVN